MKGIVNPFEPWRPVEDRVPPPLHASRPWRPTAPPPRAAVEEALPVAEAVDSPTPKRCGKRKCPLRVERVNRPASDKANKSSEANRPVGVVALFLLLGVAAVVGLCWLGETHFLRVMIPLLALAVGFSVGISTTTQRLWHARLGWMVAGLAFAGLAAWFVPTLNGVSLWSAYRQVEELRTLPAGDVAAYQGGAAQRRRLVEEFPSFVSDLRSADLAWLRRTVDAAIESADRQLENDPHAAFAELRQLNNELAALENFSSVRDELQAAQRRALQACAKAIQRR
jgi:hypothetical protein